MILVLINRWEHRTAKKSRKTKFQVPWTSPDEENEKTIRDLKDLLRSDCSFENPAADWGIQSTSNCARKTRIIGRIQTWYADFCVKSTKLVFQGVIKVQRSRRVHSFFNLRTKHLSEDARRTSHIPSVSSITTFRQSLYGTLFRQV